jgi:hypothetical protein
MGRLPTGSTPAERRWKQGRVSRATDPAAPVDRPDEALKPGRSEIKTAASESVSGKQVDGRACFCARPNG